MEGHLAVMPVDITIAINHFADEVKSYPEMTSKAWSTTGGCVYFEQVRVSQEEILQMFKQQIAMAGLVSVLLAASASADSLVYVVTDSDQFGTVDLASGAFHQIGSDTPGGQATLVAGPNGTLLSLTFSGNLESINTATGVTAVIGNTGLGGATGFGVNLAESGGTLYATDSNNNLYTLNSTTGAAHLIGPTGIPGVPATGVFDESLYGVGGKLYATFDAFTPPVSSPGIIDTPELYQIDSTTGAATRLGSTMLGLSASVDLDGSFYAFKEGLVDPSCPGAAPVPCTSDAELFTLNLTNGSTGFLTDVSGGSTAILGASPVTPEPASLALTGAGIVAVGMFLRRRRRA